MTHARRLLAVLGAIGFVVALAVELACGALLWPFEVALSWVADAWELRRGR